MNSCGFRNKAGTSVLAYFLCQLYNDQTKLPINQECAYFKGKTVFVHWYKNMTTHVAGSEYVFEYVNYEVMLIDVKYIVIKTL